jgi:UDP-GlcNAc:undecaprenyl-phosphate GlcNAc-1-phosphate transferase
MWLELLFVFVLSAGLIWTVRHFAPKVGLLDVPNERSSHKNIIPRGAGIGFASAIFIVFTLFNTDLLLSYTWTSFAIAMVFFIGLLDDYRETSPHTKFFIIILATLFLYFDGIVIDVLGIFFGVKLQLDWLALPFTIFAVTGFTNALNLIDGLDGLSGTISIIILVVFLFVGKEYGDTFLVTLSSLTIVSLLAFLLFNWYPATIFMGDSGSLTLGFVISVLAIKSLAYVPTVSILFIAALPILDTLIVMIRRKRNGRSFFSADRCHMHHVLKHFFAEDTKKTVIALGIMQAIYSLTGLQLDKQNDEGVILILFFLNVILLYLMLNAMIKRQNRKC